MRPRIPTLRPMPSDPVPSAPRVTTLRPSAPVLAQDVAITPQVASLRPAAVISAAPTPRIASMRPIAATAAVSQPPAAEHSVRRASRTLSTKRIAVLSWFPDDPAHRPRAIAIAAAAVCVLVAIAVLLIGRPAEPAAIHVATEPLDASVTLDGVEVAGSTSPFVFTHVTPDTPHVVEVSKPGYRSWSTTLTLRSGRELKLPVVRLARDASAAPPAVPAPRAAQALAGARRAVAPVPASPRVAPAPAAERRPAPSPARAPRKAKRRQPSHATAPKAPAPAPAAAAQPSHIVTVAPVSRTDVGTGKLRINSRPWSQVYVDGRLIGNTPRTDVVLSAGVHTVTLIAPDFGYKRVLSIPIKHGEMVTKIVDLAN
jgi:hypothetical protein